MAEEDPVQAGVEEELEAPKRPLWMRVGIVILIVAMVAFLFPVVARLFLPPIHPSQKAPPGHFTSECGACHEITVSVHLKVYPGYQ